MKNVKVIAYHNLPQQLSLVNTVVCTWFLLEHFTREWQRTLIILATVVLVAFKILVIWYSEKVDIFEKK